MNKTDLQAIPMFRRQRDAIEAHLTIVFAVLAVAKFMQNQTGLCLLKVMTTLYAAIPHFSEAATTPD